MKAIILILPLFLCGCADLSAIIAPTYVPVAIHVYDAGQYAADQAECRIAGANWKPKLALGAIATKTIDGATANASLIPISPLVPVAGAAGGALGDGLNVSSASHNNVFRHCLYDETQIDHSAVIARPED